MQQAISHYLDIGGQLLHYLQLGTGKRLLVTFHGYGNTADAFLPLSSYLASDFTILCFDLPHHGRTEWKGAVLMDKKMLGTLIKQLKEQFSVPFISLAGYSIGGRVCICCIEAAPESIEQVLLVASDGLVFNPFYYFVTKNFIGKTMFRHFVGKPNSYLTMLKWLHERGAIPGSKYKFMTHYIATEADRHRLLHIWTDLHQLVPNGKTARKLIQQYRIPVHIFMGRYDKVIPLAHARRFINGMDTVQLFITEKGHQVMDKDTLPDMANCLIHTAC